MPWSTDQQERLKTQRQQVKWVNMRHNHYSNKFNFESCLVSIGCPACVLSGPPAPNPTTDKRRACCTTSWDRPNLEIWATTTWNSKLSYAISRLTCDWYRHLTATQRILALGLSSAATTARCLRNVFDGTLWHRDIYRCTKWCGIV